METNVIYNEDCYTGIKKIPDKSIDLIYIDIPYLFKAHGGGTSELAKRSARNRSELVGLKYDETKTVAENMKEANKEKRNAVFKKNKNKENKIILENYLTI